jgi:hypothetical protein
MINIIRAYICLYGGYIMRIKEVFEGNFLPGHQVVQVMGGA